MKKNVLLVFSILLVQQILQAQIADKKQNYIPQTPNNASLFKYTETPVSYYNGTVNTAIPIYEINVGGFKLPITASYHSGGIKVNEESSWIGLGWSLSNGGVISLNVVGTEDSYEPSHTADYMKYNIVPNNPNGRNGKPINVIERGTCFPDYNGVLRNFDYLQKPNSGVAYLASSNRQFDLYMYNFGNYSGKLINPKLNYYDDKFVSLDNNNIKFIQTPASFGSAGDFKAITPDGTVYLFNELEITSSYSRTGEPINTYSRHLTSVTTPEGRVITFTYKIITSTMLPGASHSYSSYTNYSQGNNPVGGGGSPNATTGWRESKSLGYPSTIQTLYLDQITWDNGSVKFISDNSREDLNGGYKLNSIEVYNAANLLIKKAEFTYDYFTGDVKYGDYMTQGYFEIPPQGYYGSITESSKKKRLKLLSVKIDDQPAYTFTYNPQTLPYKTAFSKDLWDYFNGVDLTTLPYNEIKYSLLPNPSFIGYYDKIVNTLMSTMAGTPFGHRQTNEAAMQAGILTKISYPTGGYSVYEYEAHKFDAPDGVVTNLSFTGYALARDGNMPNETKQQEFTVAMVNPGTPYNPGKIDIRLSCGCNDAQGNTLCLPFTAAQSGGNLPANGLYVTLELQTGSTWNTVQTWDFSYPEIVNNQGVYTVGYNFLQGSKYRITANYPDRADCTGDTYGKRVASISATYYIVADNAANTGTGGGLRIKTLTNYVKDNIVATKKKFTYENGVLMTKPNFLRFLTNMPFTYRAKDCYNASTAPCKGCDELGEAFPIYAPGTTYPISPMISSGYYSDPTVPYSYGANGSLVGYGKVTEEYVGQKDNGKTVYEYNNTKDIVLDDGEASFFLQNYRSNMNFNISKAPGTPSIKNLLNGLLKSQTVYSKTINGYSEVQKTLNTYRIDNSKTYWGYKTDFVQDAYNSVGLASIVFPACQPGSLFNLNGVNYAKCTEFTGTSLYFYPVLSANVNLITKSYQAISENKKIETVTNYTYNAKNQLQTESTLDSKGNQIVKTTYYVPDRLSDGAEVVEMNNRNMVDYPVEVISKDETQQKELTRSKNVYQYFNGTALLLPGLQKSSLSGNALETDVTFEIYDNKGNVLQLTSKDGVPTCYVWGYKQTYPVAKIIGATYAQVLAALSQTDNNLSYLQNLSDNALTTELNTLRNNLKTAVPTAQVSSYLYIPLVGIKQATDANGKKITYEYDASNRLQVIKDNNGHILQTFDYHYN